MFHTYCRIDHVRKSSTFRYEMICRILTKVMKYVSCEFD